MVATAAPPESRTAETLTEAEKTRRIVEKAEVTAPGKSAETVEKDVASRKLEEIEPGTRAADKVVLTDGDGNLVRNADLSDETAAELQRSIDLSQEAKAARPHVDQRETIAAAMRFLENVKGVALRIATGADEMPAAVRRTAEAVARGIESVRAWVDTRSREVWVRADKVGASEIPALLSHEVVGHLGLRALFGEAYDNFLDRVFASHAGDAEMARVMDDYKYDRNTESGRRALAEEFLAKWSEARGTARPAWYKSMVARIRTWLGKIFPSLRVTDAEIENALARSAEATRNGGLEKSGSATQASDSKSQDAVRFEVEEVNKIFNDELAQYNTLKEGHVFQLGMPSQILLDYGLPNLPIELSRRQIEVKSKLSRHLFPVASLQNMVNALQNPIAIFEYSDPSILNVIIDLTERGKHFLVGIHMKSGYRGTEVNNIRGLFPRDAVDWLRWIQKGKALYLDKNKVQNIVAQVGMNFPQVNDFDLNLVNKIIAEFDNASHKKTNAEDNLRLSVESSEARAAREYAEVEARFKGTDKWMKAPNGVETRLSERQWVQVRTPSFKEWFGDWEADPANASGVLDANGEPRVLYHGSSKWFTAFNEGGQHQSGAPDGSIFMSDNREIANSFVAGNWYGLSDGMQSRQSPDVVLDPNSPLHRRYRWGVDREGGIYPLFANMRNPLVVDFNGETWQNGPGGKDINQIVRDAQGQGKDGVIAKDIRDVGAVDANVEVPASTVFVTFKPNQVKSATENIGTFDGAEAGLRFSLSTYSELDQRGMVAALRMYCTSRFHPDRGADYFALLRRLGFEPYCEADALEFAEQACALNRQERQERLARAREDWLSQKYQILQEVLEYTGKTLPTLKLKPSHEYLGEEFNSSFVDRAFDEYARSRDKGRKLRAKVLNAEGAATDEVAQAIAERRGVGDARAVEEEIVEFFRNRHLKDLYKEYADARAEEKVLSREQAARAKEEAEASARYQAAEEAEAILAEKREITPEYARENPLVWEQVWRQVVGEGEAPANPGEAELAVVNSAIRSEGFNPADLVSRLQAQRERMRDDYLKRLSTIREALRADRADALALQRAALDFAREHLEEGAREEFARSIVNLAQYSNSPSAVHPEGRRVFEFNRIVARMLEASAEGRRSWQPFSGHLPGNCRSLVKQRVCSKS